MLLRKNKREGERMNNEREREREREGVLGIKWKIGFKQQGKNFHKHSFQFVHMNVQGIARVSRINIRSFGPEIELILLTWLYGLSMKSVYNVFLD